MPPITHRTLLALLSFVAFISLGLPDGLLGVAWPYMRADFRLPISRVGWLLGSGVAGYLVSSFSTGQIMRWMSVGWILLLSTILVAVSLVGYAIVPRWELLLPAAFCVGLGSGAIDAAMNVFAASAFSARLVTWMHAAYGVGATIGPACMTAAVTTLLFATPPGWRWGYGSLAIVLAGTAVSFAMTLKLWRTRPDADHAHDEPHAFAGAAEALRHPIVRLHIILFFIYAGIEVTAGVFLFSLLVESRGLSPAVSGSAVTLYWASLALGRIVFGQVAASVSATTILVLTTAAAPVAAALLWVPAGAAVALPAAALLGFSLAPIYPMFISVTPARVGRRFSAQAIGFQVSAATIGIAVLPSVAGVLARLGGLNVIPPFLVAATLTLLALNAWTVRATLSSREEQPATAQ